MEQILTKTHKRLLPRSIGAATRKWIAASLALFGLLLSINEGPGFPYWNLIGITFLAGAAWLTRGIKFE